MTYYARTIMTTNPPTYQIWQFDNDLAVLVGVTNPEQTPGGSFRAQPGEPILDAIRRQATGWFGLNGESPFHKIDLVPGQYYPRMARPRSPHLKESPGINPGEAIELNSIAVAHGQLNALTTQLDQICQTVHPTDKTFETFGHSIRNLLILACTEVESHWRGILTANGVVKKAPFTTQDYVVLCKAMRLDEYAVVFPSYPWIAPKKPFDGWNIGAPTQSLKWYDAYNAVKHDRENKFEQATLHHAFHAVTACGIMMAAQYGLHTGSARRSSLKSFFSFAEVPCWEFNEVYIYPYNVGAWTPIFFAF